MSEKKDVAQKINKNVKKEKNKKENKINNKNIKSRKTKAINFLTPFNAALIITLVFLFALIIFFNINKYINLKNNERFNIGVVLTEGDDDKYHSGIYMLLGQNKPRYNFTIFDDLEKVKESETNKDIELYIYNDEKNINISKNNPLIYKNLKLVFRNQELFDSKNFDLTNEQFNKLQYSTITTRKHINFNGEESVDNELLDINDIRAIDRLSNFAFILMPIFILPFLVRPVYELIENKKLDKKKDKKKDNKKDEKKSTKKDKKKESKKKEAKKVEKVLKDDKKKKEKNEKKVKDDKKKKEDKKSKSVKEEIKEEKVKEKSDNKKKVESKKTETKNKEEKESKKETSKVKQEDTKKKTSKDKK